MTYWRVMLSGLTTGALRLFLFLFCFFVFELQVPVESIRKDLPVEGPLNFFQRRVPSA